MGIPRGTTGTKGCTVADIAPDHIRSAAGKWYDGGDSAMYAVWMSKPFRPYRLAQEILTALASVKVTSKHFDAYRAELLAMQEWVGGMIRLHRARLMLAHAIRDAYAAGMTTEAINAMRDQALAEHTK